ncbi:MAG: sigma-70 family RNA polymerase sigma factor [Deltaproteobacteria bacterium]|nr:sigma-70 family RNA polymerase sigma factor [Deltaproteobacteria bacterium]
MADDENDTDATATALPVPVATSGLERVPRDALSRYFYEVGRYALLSREEELALAERVFASGDPEAAQRLVLSNLRLVVKIALEYRRVWTNPLDLIQEGNVGLLQGVKRFDPHRGVKLSSYASYWIRAYILKYLIDNIRMVRVGSSRAERKLFFQLSRVKRELEREGLDPEPRLLAERLGVREPEVVDLQHRLAHGDLSTDAPVRRDEPGGASFGESLASSDGRLDDAVAEQDMRRTLREHIDRFAVDLGDREQKILRERVLAEEPKTLQEIGDELGLTRERIRQLEKNLVDGLRDYMKANLVDFEYWSPEG